MNALEQVIEDALYEIRVYEQEDSLPEVECDGASFHLAKVKRILLAAAS